MSTKKLLFATDYSDSTDHVLTYAASLARDKGATLLVAHVSQLEQYPVGELFDEDARPSNEELARLNAVTPPDPLIPSEHRLLYGDPAEEIIKLADQEGVEAIIIGAHDRSRLLRLLGGSVAETLLRTAHCPVIAYRMGLARSAVSDGGAAALGGRVDAHEKNEKTRRFAATGVDLRRTVREWTAHRPELYGVFNKNGIDVLWDGDKPLAEVCCEKDLNPRHVADDLAAALRPAYRETGANWHQASIRDLCDHIEATHHGYLRRELPRLAQLVHQTADAHHREHPELEELREIFDAFHRQLIDHVENEANRLFPALRSLEGGERPEQNALDDPRGFIDRMREDHEVIEETMLQIRRLTNGYTAPAGASAGYRAMLGGLWEFEANLQLNMHEEDEILFPKALHR
jgi:iron-sulfur cluster repair di-iron protein